MQYEDFAIRISSGTGRQYRMYINCPAASGEATLELPFDLEDLAGTLAGVAKTVRGEPGAAAVRELEPVDDPAESAGRDPTADFGVRLYRAIFQGSVQSMLDQSLGAVRTRPDTGLRIRLEMDLRGAGMKEVASLPWELMRREPTDVPLSVSKRTTLVRALDVMQPANPIAFEPPLRILVIIANPTGTAALNLDAERRRIRDSWGGLPDVEVHFVKPHIEHIMDACAEKNFHVIHYMGHGGFDARTGEGILFLEHPDGSADPLGSEQLKAIFLDEQDSLRLVFLNACKTAVSTAQAELDPFAGIATMLIEVGVPAVVAMQFPISDDAALRFADTFYRRLVRGQPVDTAVAEGRKALWVDRKALSEWATPVLFMRSKDGALFSTVTRRDTARASWEMPSKTDIMQAVKPSAPATVVETPGPAPHAEPTPVTVGAGGGAPPAAPPAQRSAATPSAPAGPPPPPVAPATPAAGPPQIERLADTDRTGIRISRRTLAIGGGVAALLLAGFLAWRFWPAPRIVVDRIAFADLPEALSVGEIADARIEVRDAIGQIDEELWPDALEDLYLEVDPDGIIDVEHAGFAPFSIQGISEGMASIRAVGVDFDGATISSEVATVLVGPTAEVAGFKALNAAQTALTDDAVSDSSLLAEFEDLADVHADALAALERSDYVDDRIAAIAELIELGVATASARALFDAGELTASAERAAIAEYLQQAQVVRQGHGPTIAMLRDRDARLAADSAQNGFVRGVAVCSSSAAHCVDACPVASANTRVRSRSAARFTVCYVRGNSADVTVEVRAPDGQTSRKSYTASARVDAGYRISDPIDLAGKSGTWQIRVLNAAGTLVWLSNFDAN